MNKNFFFLIISCLIIAFGLSSCYMDNSEEIPRESSEEDVIITENIMKENVLVDNEYCTMTIYEIEPEGDFGYTLKAYLENKTEYELIFVIEDVSVNDYMCDPYWAVILPPGKMANTQISWSQYLFDNNGISEVNNIEFILKVSDNEDLDKDDFVNIGCYIMP